MPTAEQHDAHPEHNEGHREGHRKRHGHRRQGVEQHSRAERDRETDKKHKGPESSRHCPAHLLRLAGQIDRRRRKRRTKAAAGCAVRNDAPIDNGRVATAMGAHGYLGRMREARRPSSACAERSLLQRLAYSDGKQSAFTVHWSSVGAAVPSSVGFSFTIK